jgi:TonB family protein
MSRLMMLAHKIKAASRWLPVALLLGSAVNTGWAQAPPPKTENQVPGRGPTQTPTRQPSIDELIDQGKAHYRAARFKQALAKFEAALKITPDNDDALGLAAITAFRLDNQEQARMWFIRRAELLGQKDSVKAFSYDRVALTYWRQVHDLIAKATIIKENKIGLRLPDADRSSVSEGLREGLNYAERALEVNANYSEAYNIKNLLHSEAALAADDEGEAGKNHSLAVAALKKAIRLHHSGAVGAETESANFNLPTVRIGEIPQNKEQEATFTDPMLKLIEGGRPLKRASPVFPSMRPAKPKVDSRDPSSTGVTDKGGAYSIGSGRGALTAAYAPGTVKVEVLISKTGDVVFAHVVDGRDDLNGAALLAARAWKFAPPRFEGTPVQLSGVITFDMRPGGGRPRATPTPTPTPKPAAR